MAKLATFTALIIGQFFFFGQRALKAKTNAEMALDKVVKLKALMDNYKLAGRMLGL